MLNAIIAGALCAGMFWSPSFSDRPPYAATPTRSSGRAETKHEQEPRRRPPEGLGPLKNLYDVTYGEPHLSDRLKYRPERQEPLEARLRTELARISHDPELLRVLLDYAFRPV